MEDIFKSINFGEKTNEGKVVKFIDGSIDESKAAIIK